MSKRRPLWSDDVLPGFVQTTIALKPDEEGEVAATLVRRDSPDVFLYDGSAATRRRWWPWSRRAVESVLASGLAAVRDAGVDVLYVHGWCDYFFQVHLADFWEGLGVRFWALDLRKYGRSLREHQTPGFVTDLGTYDAEIEAALAIMGHGSGTRTKRKVVLMGPSTGGLVLSLWADRHPGRVDGVVLNSPWLEFQMGPVGRRALEGPLKAGSYVAPKGHLINVDQGFYVRSISKRYDGEWEFDSEWRPDLGWRATAAWASAIFAGHERVAQGLHIDAPILVLLSAAWVPPLRWSDDMMWKDSVLDVDTVAQRVPWLGHLVTLAKIDGALHDVTLSRLDAREQVWQEMRRWFNGYITAQ